MQSLLIKIGVAVVAAFILITSTLFIVPQTSQALVLQFGEITRVVHTPGLHAKIPFVQNVMLFDKRILEFEAPPSEFITSDREMNIDERVVIDAFVRYRITDPVQFYQAVRNEANLNSRLSSIVISSMRRILADHSLSDLLSTQRSDIMQKIKRDVNIQVSGAPGVAARSNGGGTNVQGFGIQIIDLRIVRADLPSNISQSTYERMRKNFTKEAQLFRAEGDQKATQTRASAERERTEILAEARKTAEITRGEGDAEAAHIYAEAYGRDPEFFKFYRSMQAYRATITPGDTSMVLTPEHSFLREMNPGNAK